MKIGEFAQLCHTNISLLHYYQKTGLLFPDYVDPFTGYRYYTSEQIPVFFRIRSLKQAGFELNEIKKMIAAQKIPLLSIFFVGSSHFVLTSSLSARS